MNYRPTNIVLPLLLVFSFSCARVYQFSVVETSSEASFRGLSVVDDDVAWISGSEGTVGRTTDGGTTWNIGTVEGFENVGFRSIYAFDENSAIIGNAGSVND